MKAPKKATLKKTKMSTSSLPTNKMRKSAPGMTGYKAGGKVC